MAKILYANDPTRYRSQHQFNDRYRLLLLTFFLVTTVIENHKGIPMLLPQLSTVPPLPWKDRNLFNVQINSHDQFLVEGEKRENLAGLREQLKKFILNNGTDETLSENPEKALISLKTDRGTN